MQITVEDTQLETRTKAGGKGTYQVQKAYAHTFNRNGTPKRYPEEIVIFPQRDPAGNPTPYQKGDYQLAPDAISVKNGFLDLGFINLIPVKK